MNEQTKATQDSILPRQQNLYSTTLKAVIAFGCLPFLLLSTSSSWGAKPPRQASKPLGSYKSNAPNMRGYRMYGLQWHQVKGELVTGDYTGLNFVRGPKGQFIPRLEDPTPPPTPAKLSAKHKLTLNNNLTKALRYLKSMGLAPPDSWAPLHPTKPIVKVYLDTDASAVANVYPKVNLCRPIVPQNRVFLNLGKKAFSFPALLQYVILTHEMVHLVQYSKYFVEFCGGFPHEGRRVTEYANFNMKHQDFREMMWFHESMADAISHSFLSKPTTASARAAYDKWIAGRAVRNYYRLPLIYFRRKNIAPYQTQHFWRHVRRVYYKKSKRPYSFMQRILQARRRLFFHSYKRKPPRVRPYKLWVSLIHQRFIKDFRRPLSHVFATFMATLASKTKLPLPIMTGALKTELVRWVKGGLKHSNQFKTISRNLWLTETFSGCPEITLSAALMKKGKASVQHKVKLSMFTATCLRVKVVDIQPQGRALSVKIMAVDTKRRNIVGQYDLALAHTNDRVGFHCERSVLSKRRSRRLRYCLMTPAQEGTRKKKAGKTKPGSTKKSKAVGAQARYWRALKQFPRRGAKSFENLYVLTRSPVVRSFPTIGKAVPKYRKPASVLKPTKRQELTLNIGLQYATLQKKTKGRTRRNKAKGSYVVSNLNLFIGGSTNENSLTNIPMQGKDSMQKANPNDPKQMVMFAFKGHSINNVLNKLRQKAQGNGIQSIRWSLSQLKAQPGSDNTRYDLEPFEAYHVFLKKPLALGQTGTFDAIVKGQTVGPQVSAFSMPKIQYISKVFPNEQVQTKLKVLEFSSAMFRAELTGPVCEIDTKAMMASAFQGKKKDPCPKLVTITATLLQPFPDLYTGNSTFETRVTPSWLLYKKYHIMPMMQEALQAQQAAPPTPQPPPKRRVDPVKSAASSAAQALQCICDCSYKKAMAKLIQELQKNPDPKKDKELARLARCQVLCTMKGKYCP